MVARPHLRQWHVRTPLYFSPAQMERNGSQARFAAFITELGYATGVSYSSLQKSDIDVNTLQVIVARPYPFWVKLGSSILSPSRRGWLWRPCCLTASCVMVASAVGTSFQWWEWLPWNPSAVVATAMGSSSLGVHREPGSQAALPPSPTPHPRPPHHPTPHDPTHPTPDTDPRTELMDK